MPTQKSYLFASYARPDLERVQPLFDSIHEELAFRALPVELWVDARALSPGEDWEGKIEEALRRAIGFLFVVSPRALESGWVRRELSIAESSERFILPVVLYRPELSSLPRALAERHWIDYSGSPTPELTRDTAKRVVDSVEDYLKTTPGPEHAVATAAAPAIAADIANEIRASIQAPQTPATGERPTSVFVVHGHNTEALKGLEDYLVSVGISALVLSRRDESPQSLFQKFMSVATQARFAIVLLAADDYGASRKQYDTPNVGERALQFRSRQNVILELGFFYGHLGWENVFLLYYEPDRVFPNFERPSDLDGVVLDSMADVGWRRKLGEKLSNAGFSVPPQASI
jgi:predicted nucleotide-binding protein